MRNVIYVLTLTLAALMWLNTSTAGRQIARHMSEPSRDGPRVY